MNENGLLPPEFSELESHVDWALPTVAQRRAKRLGSSMEAIETFYQAMLPKMGDIAAYLNGFELSELDESQQRLLDLAFSFMAVAPAVEIFGQPEVKGNTFPYSRFVESDPVTGVAIAAA